MVKDPRDHRARRVTAENQVPQAHQVHRAREDCQEHLVSLDLQDPVGYLVTRANLEVQDSQGTMGCPDLMVAPADQDPTDNQAQMDNQDLKVVLGHRVNQDLTAQLDHVENQAPEVRTEHQVCQESEV